jgi:hypothetical protein
MRFRCTYFLLLAALVYWTTGTALYLHERIEHAEPDGAPEIALLPMAGHATSGNHSPAPKHHHHNHNHDDCPTCQLLAHMRASHMGPAVFVSVFVPSFISLQLTDRHVPGVDAIPTGPIRGPPVDSLLFV